MLEVLDPKTRFRFLPGVVTEVINQYFFRVKLLMPEDSPQPVQLVFHRGSTDVFPANYASRNGMRLTVPAGYDETNFTIYKVKGRPATDTQFDIPRNVERFDGGRHVEVYDETRDLFIVATILRQHKHLLALRFETERDMTNPRFFAY